MGRDMTPGVLEARDDPIIVGGFLQHLSSRPRKNALSRLCNKIYQLGALSICRAHRGSIRARKRRPNHGVEAANVGRLCGGYEKRLWLRGRIVVGTGKVGPFGPMGLRSSRHRSRERGAVPRENASAGESC
jgi:hypothetical protein